MKKPEIKYVGWCHECKHLGSFICGNCNPNEKYSCYLCINNRKTGELSENPECSNCIQLGALFRRLKKKS